MKIVFSDSTMWLRNSPAACCEDLRGSGFPEYLVDEEPEAQGAEVRSRQAND